MDPIVEKAQRDLRRLRRHLPSKIFGEKESRRPKLRLSLSLEPGAWVTRSGDAVATVGMMRAVEDVLLAALATGRFFDVTGSDKWQDDLPIRVTAPSDAVRHDLASGRNGTAGLTTASLTAVMPTDEWRLCQFELLRELAVAWLYMHEVAHWVDGHLGLLRAGDARKASGFIGLNDDGGPNVRADTLGDAGSLLDSSLRRAVELRADHLGFGLLCRMEGLATEEVRGAFARYARRVARLSDRSIAERIALDLPARVRAALIAAGTVVLVLEHLARAKGHDASYPLPATRLLNLQLAVLAISKFVRSEPEGDAFLSASAAADPSFRRYVTQALGWPIIDLEVPAEQLGLQGLLGLGDGSAGLEGATPFVGDLLRWFETQDPEKFVTQAGRELASSLDQLRELHSLAVFHRPLMPPS